MTRTPRYSEDAFEVGIEHHLLDDVRVARVCNISLLKARRSTLVVAAVTERLIFGSMGLRYEILDENGELHETA